MSRLAIALIRAYQRLLSPLLGNHCRFEPTCSVYGTQAIEHYGVLRGIPLTLWRIMQCNPLSSGGYDLVAASETRELRDPEREVTR